jgi:hypothetical protein
MSLLVSLEQGAEATVLDATKSALSAIEGVVVTEVQDDIIPGLLAFLENAASATVSKLGSFLSGLVADITGSGTQTAAPPPAPAPAAVSPAPSA